MISGARMVEPDIASKCCKLIGTAWVSGSFSSGSTVAPAAGRQSGK